MCGVAGLVNWGTEDDLARMTRLLRHRGPDDEGVFTHRIEDGSWVGLGSRRLAILDLSPAGHMPMQTPDGSLTIAYNGEVYNYPALRAHLEAKGYTFRSHADTEAILYLYEEYGPSCVERLNGIFAIAIWDQRNQQLFLARDHFGVKPLYYICDGNRLAFASEGKALLELADFPRELDPVSLRQYLAYLWVPEPGTMWKHVHKLPAGHFAIFKQGRLEVQRYWDLTFPAEPITPTDSAEALVEEVRERFFATVQSQMLSDVPVGAFLSAGLDSSSIVAAMASDRSQDISTFTITFPKSVQTGEVLDDADVAKRTAAHFGTRHTEIVVEPDVIDLLPKLVWHMDDPTADPAIITAFLVNREARKGATVLLSGVGGDEVFAGYRKYQAHELAQTYQRLPASLRSKLIEPAIERMPEMQGTPVRSYVRFAKKMARSASLPPQERFIRNSIYISDDEQRELLGDEQLDGTTGFDIFAHHKHVFSRVEHADFLNKMLYVDSNVFMPSLNLAYNDKMSMASSVEVRVPFLDPGFAQWVASNVPPSMKIEKGVTKSILRKAMRGILPAEVLHQKKAGFGAPIAKWLATDLAEMVDDVLHRDRVAARGLFRPETVERFIMDQRTGKKDRSYQIWSLLTLELWMQQFLDE